MIFNAGAALPPNFRDVQNAFLIEICNGLAEERYPDITRRMYEYDNPFSDVLYQLPALMDFPNDQTAPRAPSIVKRVISSAQSFFLGTPSSTQRSSSRGYQIRTTSQQAPGSRNDVVAFD